jgi:hypothetical protein
MVQIGLEAPIEILGASGSIAPGCSQASRHAA